MEQRPRVFVLLAILHFVEPFSKILYFKLTTLFPLMTIMENVLAIEGAKNNFEFWFLFPLAGLCLLFLRKWTYHLFLFIQGYSIHSILNYQEYTWPYISKTPIASSVILLLLNIAAIIYLLLPHNRAPFFDRRLRWWETKPRFGAIIPVAITGLKGDFFSKILNIGLSGVFIEDIPNLKVGDNIKILIKNASPPLIININGIVKNRRTMNGIDGLGVEFVYTNLKDYLKMRFFIREISSEFKNSYTQKAA